jgi:D-alanine-D-alanine ligase
MPKRIAILAGGESDERKVSLLSGKFVHQQTTRFYQTTFFDFPKDLNRFIKNKRLYKLAIPVFHGRGGEDGQIQGFLKTLGIPFLFSDIDGHSAGINKIFTRKIAQQLGIDVPSYQILTIKDKPVFKSKCVIKPYDNGSSVNVQIINSAKELKKGLKKIFQRSSTAIKEEYIAGEEYTVGVIEKKGKPIALPVIWIKPKNPFFNYESKYTTGMAEEICPALIKQSLTIKMQQTAILIHQTLLLKHLSRSDFLVDKKGQPYFLEVNTIPGLTKNSLIPKAVKTAGFDFGYLLKEWIENTLNGH